MHPKHLLLPVIFGNEVTYGRHSVLHGGSDDGNTPPNQLFVEDGVSVGDWAVVFRSTIGAGSTIGFKSLVDGSQLAPGTVIPNRTVIINNEVVGEVEW